MKHVRIAAIVAALGSACAGHAATPDLRHLTIRQARHLVETKQSVTLADRGGSETYVSDDGQCAAGMKVVPAFVVAKDTHGAAVHLGSRCAASDANTFDGGGL
jgi:hypothetical protein